MASFVEKEPSIKEMKAELKDSKVPESVWANFFEKSQFVELLSKTRELKKASEESASGGGGQVEQAPLPSIKEMKDQIKSLGYEEELKSASEKQDVINLLETARSKPKTKKIPVILLGEMHESAECALMTLPKLGEILVGDNPPATMLKRNEFLLVSEGRGVNFCYERMNLPRDRIIIEHPTEEKTKIEMIDKLTLIIPVMLHFLNGHIKNGKGHGIPDTVIINKKWFMDRANNDGFQPILKLIPNGERIYDKLVDDAIKHDKSEFYTGFETIFNYLVKSNYLDDVSMSADIKRILTKFIENKNITELSELSTIFREIRDASIIKRIEERTKEEKSSLKLVVIIFGALHYENLQALITKSPFLSFSEKSTNIYASMSKGRSMSKGGKKTKKYISKLKLRTTRNYKKQNKRKQRKTK